MSSAFSTWRCILASSILTWFTQGSGLFAQEVKTGPKILLPTESRQAQARLQAVDLLRSPWKTPEKAASWTGALAPHLGALVPWSACLGAMGELIAWDPWDQAILEYQQLFKEAGEALVTSTSPAQSALFPSQSVSLVCRQRLNSWPSAVVRRYRALLEGPAKIVLQEGKQKQSALVMRRLVDEYYGTRSAQDALDWLGDQSFSEGDFEQARGWWRQLSRLPSETVAPHESTYPDLSLDPALIQAKQILAMAFAGNWRQALGESKSFRARHGLTKGYLAGRVGPLADLVEAEVRRLTTLAGETNELPWPTFAGGASRQRVLHAFPSSRLWADGPAWRISLPGPIQDKDSSTHRLNHPPRILHDPVIFQGQVCLANTLEVWCHDLATGLKKEAYRLPIDPERPLDGEEVEAAPSVWGGRLFARLGRATSLRGPQKEAAPGSYLVCLKLTGPGQPDNLQEIWRRSAKGPGGQVALFEGDPLVLGNRAWIAMSWQIGAEVQIYLACYHARDGTLAWMQPVAQVSGDALPGPQNNRLTWTGTAIVYHSPYGLLAALDPWSGRKLWAIRLPQTLSEESEVGPRDELSCLADGSRLWVASSRANYLLGVDGSTGQVLWQRDGLGATQLWGTARNRLVFATTRGLRAVAADDGGNLEGWTSPSEGTLPALGRGLLAGGWVLWPTRDPLLPYRAVGIYDGQGELAGPALSPWDGPEVLEPTGLRRLLSGNMAMGEGCLVVAGPHELAGYLPPEGIAKTSQRRGK